jgi:hypothetical protein
MTRSVDFYHTEASKEMRHISGTCLSKRPSTVFCTLSIVVYLDTLSPSPSNSSDMKTSENTEQNPDDPELADEGNIQME